MSAAYLGDGVSTGPLHWYPRTVSVPGREPPHNREAEAGVLGSVLLDSSVLPAVIEVLRPEHFWDDRFRLLYRTLLRLHERGTPIDPITLREELVNRGEFDDLGDAGGDDFLMTLLDGVPHAVNAVYWAKIVRGKAVGRILAEEAEETLRAVYSQAYSPEDLIERAARGVARAEADIPPPDRGGGPAAEPKGYPRVVAPAAFYGLAGEFARLIEPHSEADPLAILLQFLTMAGNVIGRRAHWRIEASTHRLNLFTCIVGNSSQGRKGTSYDHCRRAFEEIDPAWLKCCVRRGLASGEGMIEAIKDPVYKREKLKEGGYRDVEVDPGVDDKRALWLESEFGSVLDVAAREGNTLSAKLRCGWDGETLSSSTKGSPVHATDPHVSIIGHITSYELLAKVGGSDLANGFANRFLWVCVKRSKRLPHGGDLQSVDFSGFRARLAEAVAFAREEAFGPELLLRRDEAADRLWEEAYDELTAARHGVLGSVCSRGAAQAMRLAALYAVLDCSPWIGRVHLEAGLALWRYAEESAAYIFGDMAVNADESKVLAALKESGAAALSTNQINRKVYSGHRKADDLNRTLLALERDGLIVSRQVEATARTGNRPATVWSAATAPGGP